MMMVIVIIVVMVIAEFKHWMLSGQWLSDHHDDDVDDG